LQWLQDPNHNKIDNMNTVILEAIRHFSNKKKEYLKAKISKLETQ